MIRFIFGDMQQDLDDIDKDIPIYETTKKVKVRTLIEEYLTKILNVPTKHLIVADINGVILKLTDQIETHMELMVKIVGVYRVKVFGK